MHTRRLEALAFTALLLAGAALFISLQGNARAAAGSQPVEPAAVAAAPVQETFNYQGILREIDGALMNGSRDLTVKLYDAPINGTALHTETHTSVAVRDGLFNVVLGDQPNNALSGKLSVSPRYVAIILDGAELLPRQRIHPVPLALQSENANNAIKATTLVPNASVSGLTVNGTTNMSGNAFIGGTAVINGKLQFLNLQAPIVVKSFSTAISDGDYDTGVSSELYHCSVGGWSTVMDINEAGATSFARLTFPNNTGTWMVRINNPAHQFPAVNTVEVVCFHRSLATVLP